MTALLIAGHLLIAVPTLVILVVQLTRPQGPQGQVIPGRRRS